MKENKLDILLFSTIIVTYLCFVVSTFVGSDFLIGIFSPLTGIAIAITILCCLGRMGRYWKPSFLLALGIICYVIADIIYFFGNYVFKTPTLSEYSTFIFVLPNYFFGASVGLYFIQKLKDRNLYQFLINTLVMTVIGLVAFSRILFYVGAFDNLETQVLVQIYLYFTINLFILIMIGHMVVMIATETGLKGTNTMILGIIVYIIMDVPYTGGLIFGQNPENKYFNLIYMACMILMAHGIWHQVHHHHVFVLKSYTYNESTAKRTSVIVIVGILLSCLLRLKGYITTNELWILAVVLLAYWITRATFQNSALNEQLIKQQDILTGLYNRRYLSITLADSARRAVATNTGFAIFCIDLNNFKPINDTYGHDMGDRVLKEFGQRMLALPTDYISFRTGGDEFMIVKNNLTKEDDLDKLAQNLNKLFNNPLHIDTYIFSLSGSIGVSVYPDDTDNTEILIRYADAAMYSVKHSSNKDAYRIFDISLVEKVKQHKSLEEKLKNADPSKDFVLHFQPRFDVQSGKLIAAEVFPRLKDDITITANELLPIAEEVGLMSRLGNWVIDEAICQLKNWQTSYNKDMSMSINLSPLQLLDTGFLKTIEETALKQDISPSDIHLDISNDVIMGASVTAKETLKKLRAFGFKLSLNDFGGNDINLSHLITCGFSAIHLSPSLIKRADTDKDAATLIKTVIAIASSLKINVYAVGIERKEQATKLAEIGVITMQGFYYGKPVSAAEFEDSYL